MNKRGISLKRNLIIGILIVAILLVGIAMFFVFEVSKGNKPPDNIKPQEINQGMETIAMMEIFQ